MKTALPAESSEIPQWSNQDGYQETDVLHWFQKEKACFGMGQVLSWHSFHVEAQEVGGACCSKRII